MSAVLHRDREVYVGWDDPLQTYFAQVRDGTDEHGEDRLTVDVGGGFGDITYPGGAIAAIRPYAEIPEDLGELLNISRVSTTPTYTDLRPESRSYQQDRHLESELGRLYRPEGFVTELTREDVTPVLNEHGWTAADIRATDGGHAETYRRGDQELSLSWTWPDQDYDTERLLSPIRVDGERYGVDSREALSSTLAEGSPDSQTLTPASEERVESLLTDIFAADETQTDAERLDNERDSGLDASWFDDPPSDDHGFHSGLGT
ncbi:hypothetical protein DMP23_21360 [Amycolatopsis sp. A1MSW2902]|uniref:hypothetical protein n=1 Tax=Amycolatopsis sp. A1MSW2902 TaxID=687413 RepID=UPI00307DB675